MSKLKIGDEHMTNQKEIEKEKKEITDLTKDIKKGFKTFVISSNDVGGIKELLKQEFLNN